MKRLATILIASSLSFGASAIDIQKLSDDEIRASPHIESGVACFNYVKDDIYLYSDMKKSIIKIDGKIIEMFVSGPNIDVHSSKEMNLVIKSLKNGNLEITHNGTRSIFRTKSRCGG